ncbi:MAG: hypothetical protein KKH72_01310 [Alphaproteobacteria bacterium]|nr:hypothetical protein [Alphaproteobacteria bacterium]
MNELRTPQIDASLELTISRPRLDKYLAQNNNDLALAITAYEHNTRLCEAFYSPLQGLEIALRNTIHAQMRNQWGPDWMTSGAVPLNATSQQMVAEVLAELQKTTQWPTNDSIVAEMRFAFWVGLLGPTYDGDVWRRALNKGFRASGGKKRVVVHGRMNMLRRFRNRVAHHEPIFQHNLQTVHDEILEAIGWMCPDTSNWVAFNSRVPAVLANI